MVKRRLILGTGAGCIIVAQSAGAFWTGDAELGVSLTSGNTETTVVNAKIDMDATRDKWRHNIFGDTFYSEDSGTRTAERYSLGYRPRYFLTDANYVFSILRYDQDEFAFVDNRTTEIIGYGRQVVNSAVQTWDAEIGIGLRQTDYIADPSTEDLAGDETIGFLGTKYVYRISDTAEFSETLRVETGHDNTYTESIAGLGTTITDAVSAKLSYTVRYNSDVAGVNGDKLDSITSVNLVYSF
jgi:putative salt-induced outer membrane protein